MSIPFVCRRCRHGLLRQTIRDAAGKRHYTRPSFAPRPILDVKHIRNNPGLYEQNCIDRNYGPFAKNGWRTLELHERLTKQQSELNESRRRSNVIGKELSRHAANGGDDEGKTALLEEAKALKAKLSGFEADEKAMHEEMQRLAWELPNLSSLDTPVGDEPQLRATIGERLSTNTSGKSHVDIGKELDLLDFEASATTSGWGWYFLQNEAALLEQALIQYALSVAMKRGWKVMTPPSLVYSHIASACGFMPRDQHGETQIYNIEQQHVQNKNDDRPSLVLAGTAEIPFAGSQANRTLRAEDMPLKVIGPSRCYRAEAGARGVDTKGLYRVHEFTKVEMFAWTLPPSDHEADRFGDVETPQAEEIFAEMLEIQTEILTSLGLYGKVLEMPSTDLGASATRKVDIEAFFPSRSSINDGYGELTSASICTDYQTRRLGTRLKGATGRLLWPHTVNGTAMAIPRVLACILENHWDEEKGAVVVPEVLRAYMPGGMKCIERNNGGA
ncbi:seryl-tRNA synthetase [Sphaerulina musiva SO2202]|uniref:serine--tRNA ligase n=1 Tax=Sphaerulina musiva (strain SO2202) TaxID=692275 RepID=M3D952_SPHMS|nr:seryl-tRNA synthetase [Sphaerulina musiva SO2202]EMF14680.1 seryl-tRNA synthetase [Sphaerulina musiva SO2202]